MWLSGRSRGRCYDTRTPIRIRASLFVSQIMLKRPAVAQYPPDVLRGLALFTGLRAFSLWDGNVDISVVFLAQVVQTLLYRFFLFRRESVGGLCSYGGSISTAFARLKRGCWKLRSASIVGHVGPAVRRACRRTGDWEFLYQRHADSRL